MSFVIFLTFFDAFLNTCKHNRDPIPEEGQGSTKSLPKRGHRLLSEKQSPTNSVDRLRNMQKASLLAHRSSSDSDNSDKEHGRLMKPKKQKKNFSLGDSDDDDDDAQGSQRT